MAKKIDHTRAYDKGKPPKAQQNKKEWWLEAPENMAPAIAGVVRTITDRQKRLEAQRIVSARLYGNLSVMGLQGAVVSKTTAMQPALRDRITYNVCESATDTIAARIVKNKPKPLFLTDGGDWKMQRKAKKLTKFTEGIFYENRVRKLVPQSFREACVFGDGLVSVFERHSRVCMERVLCSEYYVDDVEGFYGSPRQAHRMRNIDRRVLAGLNWKTEGANPDAVKLIMGADAAALDDYSGIDSQSIADQVTVCESWHLPSGPDSDDGMYAVTLPEHCLYSGAWKHDFFPIARLPWKPSVYGFWSRGLVESIQNIQLEMNKLLWLIQRSMHLMGTFKIALEYGSKVVKSHITNDVGAIIWYNKTAPVYLTPQVVPAEYYQHFERLKAAAYDQAGVSELSATSEKPAGLDSGKALREYDDIQSDRFQAVGQNWEEFHLELARLAIATARDIHEREGKFSVRVPGRRFLESINWKEISLEDDDYVMQVYPISSLPQDPAGRLQTVQEMAQAGLIPQQLVPQLLDYPDLEQFDTLQSAVLDRITEMLDGITDDGKYEPPDPYLDLTLARQMALQYYNRAATQGVDGERLDMLQEWMSQIDLLQQKAMPPPVIGAGGPADGMAPGAAPANPEAPPTSPLLPNVNGAAAAA